MKLEHIAVAANSEVDADKFFVQLLGMEKIRSFNVSAALMEKFFGVDKDYHVIRYEVEHLNAEVFITDDDSKAQDIFTHNCLLVKDPEDLLNRGGGIGLETIKIPRQGTGFYYFIKDFFGNLYEIKSL